MAIIETRNLTKWYKDLVAVDRLNLEITEGECFGLLGPNGAGKTSLIRMITAVSPPSEGEIFVLGHDLRGYARQLKAMLGVVPQMDNLDPDLSVLQNLLTFARYFDIPKDEARRRAEAALALFKLEAKSRGHIRELSGGMKRRLLLARALINHPRIVILDEPTVGLDPQARYLVWHKLRELKAQGITQVLCTQNMEEAALLCDRTAIMHEGRVLDTSPPSALIVKYIGERVWEIEVGSDGKDRITAELKTRGLEFEDAGDRINVFRVEDAERLKGLARDGLRPRPGTLEDVFFRLTGRYLSE